MNRETASRKVVNPPSQRDHPSGVYAAAYPGYADVHQHGRAAYAAYPSYAYYGYPNSYGYPAYSYGYRYPAYSYYYGPRYRYAHRYAYARYRQP